LRLTGQRAKKGKRQTRKIEKGKAKKGRFCTRIQRFKRKKERFSQVKSIKGGETSKKERTGGKKHKSVYETLL